MKQINTYLKKIQCESDVTTSFNVNPGIESPSKGKVLKSVYEESIEIPDHRKRIMFDFDGVIHNYDLGWNDGILGDMIPGAKDFINDLKNEGFEIVIFTSRASKTHDSNYLQQIENIKSWLLKNEIQIDLITSEKLPALAYIDDRAISFNYKTTLWSRVLEQIKNLQGLRK